MGRDRRSRRVPVLPGPKDTLLAFKAIGLSTALTGNDKAVAFAILDHFNRDSGRCDPGIDRISSLLGVSERTAMRSIRKLNKLGLILCHRHGGHNHCNFYQPNWEFFRELERAWKTAMAKEPCVDKVTEPTSQSDAGCHLEPVDSVTQTFPSNLSKKPVLAARCQIAARATDETKEKRPAGQRVGLPLWGSRKAIETVDSRDAAWLAAERRWTMELGRRYASNEAAYIAILDRIDQELQDEVTAAELAQRGTGIKLLMDRIAEKRTIRQ